MSKHTDRSGGRRGLPASGATALLAVVGAVLLGLGLFAGGDGPPEPAATTSNQQPLESSPPSSDSNVSDETDTSGKRTDPSETSSGGESDSGLALTRSEPVALDIPAIDVSAQKFVPLGLQPNGKIEVPERNDTVGWYERWPTPGQFGPAIMGAHVDSDAGPALFYNLGELESGDTVRVGRADGKSVVFTVYDVEQHPKDEFPTRKVYSPTHDRAELRLITCGGTFDNEVQHYRDNIVVYAKLTAVK